MRNLETIPQLSYQAVHLDDYKSQEKNLISQEQKSF